MWNELKIQKAHQSPIQIIETVIFFSDMCLLALHKMHQSCAGFAYTVFINYVVYFLIEEPLRKSLIIMFIYYVVNNLDQNVQGHKKYLDTV